MKGDRPPLQHTQFSVPAKDVHLFGSLDAVRLDWVQLKQAEFYKGAVLPSYLLTPQPASAASEEKPTVDRTVVPGLKVILTLSSLEVFV